MGCWDVRGQQDAGCRGRGGRGPGHGRSLGLVVTTGIKGYSEMSGSSEIGGRIDKIVAEIAKQAEPRFRDQGWIK